MKKRYSGSKDETMIRLIRRSQSLSPYGVGAVIDQSGESFVFADITQWGDKGERIDEPRLRDLLEVDHFRTGPAAPNELRNIDEKTVGIPVIRFPFWHFCPNCRRMVIVDSKHEPPTCQFCSDTVLVPMRLVMACPRGHLGDVPWIIWAHYNERKICSNPELYFITESGGSGLEYVKIKCKGKECKAENSLKGIFTQDSLKRRSGEVGPIYCAGAHPWKPGSERCDAVPKVVQRGATNLIFHKIESSIDIPPFSNEEYFNDDLNRILAHPHFSSARTWFDEGDRDFFEKQIRMIGRKLKIEEERAIELAYQAIQPKSTEKQNEQNGNSIPKMVRLRLDEYKALLEPDGEYGPRDRFAKSTVDFSTYPPTGVDNFYKESVERLKGLLGSIVRVTKLREVRALVGFSRLAPPPDEEESEGETPGTFQVYGLPTKIPAELLPPDLGAYEGADRWLPAIEVFGEGVFITLNSKELTNWENDDDVKARFRKIADRRDMKAKFLPEVTPRLILLHSLSHALIRRLSFECGYALASLRERVYARQSDEGDSMAGILIYTAAGDVEGTLGGLVRQGRAERIFPTILAALQDALWCSSDPLCRESRGQGPDSCNLAACHACSLVPETCCTMSNRLLDRMSMIGRPEDTARGYFSPLLDQLENL